MPKLYNQLAQKQSHYSCAVYAFLNIILYDYWIQLKVWYILKLIIYLEKIGALLRWGAMASIIFPAMVKVVEYETGFKLEIVKWNIWNIDNKKWRILWFKKSNKEYIKLAEDWEITKKDVEKIKEMKKGYWHFHMLKRGIILESLGGFPYRLKKINLNYAYQKDLYYWSTRAFIPWDERTKRVQKQLIKIVKDRSKGSDYKFLSFDEFLKIKDTLWKIFYGS